MSDAKPITSVSVAEVAFGQQTLSISPSGELQRNKYMFGYRGRAENLNECHGPGFWNVSKTALNYPDGVIPNPSDIVVNMGVNQVYFRQFLMPLNGDRIYMRACWDTSDTWKDWKSLTFV